MSGLLGALQFLTRLPIHTKRAVAHERVVPWFAVVGALIGAAVGGAGAGLWHVVPALVAGAGAVTFGMLVTGAFHEDGLADMADAFGGGTDRQRRMEILKDSRHGTYGVAALSASIVLRTVSAGSIDSPAWMFRAFVAAHCLSRVAAMGAMLAVSPVNTSGLGYEHSREVRRPATVIGMAAGIAVGAVTLGWWVAPVLGALVISTALVALLAVRKIGGVVGDVLGAIEQVGECVVLAMVAGLVTHGRLV